MSTEISTLKERIQKASTDSLNAQKCKMKLLNPLSRPPTMNPQTKKDEHFLNLVTSAMEEKEKELIAENQGLRKALYHFYDKAKREIQQFCDVESPAAEEREIAQFQLPLSMSWDNILSKYSQIFALLRKTGREDAHKSSHPKELEENELLIRDLRMQADDLKKQRELLEKRHAKLEDDRKRFTEAAVKLGLERDAIQMDEEQFEQEIRHSAFEKAKSERHVGLRR
ncbi:hypothetical protein HDU67_003126 [Dinochytrium kinnereticum]|nr:hypothetical protein HDU67_003126 [Dinochytrium kinnereticum]